MINTTAKFPNETPTLLTAIESYWISIQFDGWNLEWQMDVERIGAAAYPNPKCEFRVVWCRWECATATISLISLHKMLKEASKLIHAFTGVYLQFWVPIRPLLPCSSIGRLLSPPRPSFKIDSVAVAVSDPPSVVVFVLVVPSECAIIIIVLAGTCSYCHSDFGLHRSINAYRSSCSLPLPISNANITAKW